MGDPWTSRYVCAKNRKLRTGLEMMLGHKTSKPFISCEHNLEYFTLPLRIPYNHMINQ